MKLNYRSITQISILAIGLFLGACASHKTTDEARIWRVAITDAKTPDIKIWDIEERDEVAVLKTASPARLGAGAKPMQFSVIQGSTGQLQLLDIGLVQENHGNHKHWVSGKPNLSAAVLTGSKPSHANPGVGKIAAFFDGDGIARVYTIDKLSAGAASPLEIKTAQPHHGIAIPLPKNQYLISVPPAQGRLPTGIKLVDSMGNTLLNSPLCENMHGDGHHNQLFLFSCANGVMVFDVSKNQFNLIAYPASAGRAWHLLSSEKQALMIGDYGDSNLIIIDLKTMTMRSVNLPANFLNYQWDEENPQQVWTLLETGELVAIDVTSATITQRASVLPKWLKGDADAEKNLPKPQLAVAHGRVVVTDARTGQLHVMLTKNLTKSHSLAVGGQPSSLVMRSVNLDSD